MVNSKFVNTLLRLGAKSILKGGKTEYTQPEVNVSEIIDKIPDIFSKQFDL